MVMDVLIDKRIDIPRTGCLEVDCDGNMELKFVHREPSVLEQVVVKRAVFLFVLGILVLDGLMGWMSRLLIRQALFPVEDFGLAIQFIDDVGKVAFVKHHFPVKCVQIRSSFAVWREIFVVNLEQEEFPLGYHCINVGDGNSLEGNLVAHLLHFTIESAQVLIALGGREMEIKYVPIIMLLD